MIFATQFGKLWFNVVCVNQAIDLCKNIFRLPEKRKSVTKKMLGFVLLNTGEFHVIIKPAMMNSFLVAKPVVNKISYISFLKKTHCYIPGFHCKWGGA